ncbi:hypothetical protein JKF63_02517 [Porcisia hertigi]|uniref:PSP1 C-terminal domain-containing protein n=1 Tax=Porcisia hertigi TaxID=2761500 RepID=A0A836HN86_9TRYP|nr:hypothetical protein JKF63_02517 [Porcisia hertigi]
MACTAASAAAESSGVFCTPLGRPQTTTETSSVVPVEEVLDPTEAMTPLEMLSEFKAVNGCLHILTKQLHAWAKMSPCTGVYTLGGPPSAVGSSRPDTSVDPESPCACKTGMPGQRTPERDALYLLHTVVEKTRRLVVNCQSEVWILLSKSVAASSASGATSGQVSCGLSFSDSSCEPAKRSVDVLAQPKEEEKSGISFMQAAKGCPPHLSTPPPAWRSELRDTSRAPTLATDGLLRPPDNLSDFPRRRPWPADHFCYVVHVEFKRGRLRRFVSPVTLKVCTYVIVPGDRGYDCGLVVQCALWNPEKGAYEASTIQSLDRGVLSPGKSGSIMEVIRVATDEEVYRLHREHASMERLALTTSQHIVFRLHLPMELLDCEYQFDGTKISFFFESSEVIDFRQLNKELFRVFNARIWMQNINNTVRNQAPRAGFPALQRHSFPGRFQLNSSGALDRCVRAEVSPPGADSPGHPSSPGV